MGGVTIGLGRSQAAAGQSGCAANEPEGNLNRFAKGLVAVCLIVAVLVIGWYWMASKPAPARGVHAASLAPSPTDLRVAERTDVSSSASGAPNSVPGKIVEDPRCIIDTTPSPEVTDASPHDGPPAQTSATASADAPRERLMQALSTSADPYANAVAVWLDIGDGNDARSARERRLAAMAASTHDPRLYALALRTCWRRQSQECQSLSARRWSELEPDNAMPWLMMLDEAVLQQDISGFQEALYHAAHARHLAERAQAPLQAIVDVASDDPASLAAARSLAIEAIGIAAAQVGPATIMACREATPEDANSWQECTALLDLLEHRSDSLYSRMVGARIDQRLTGNGAPLAQVAAQMRQLTALDLASSASCPDLRGKLSLMRRMAVDGEMAVLPVSGR